jgi:hypothetical protein
MVSFVKKYARRVNGNDKYFSDEKANRKVRRATRQLRILDYFFDS